MRDIEHAIANQTEDFIGKTGVVVEKDEILRIMRILKDTIVRRIQVHVGMKRAKGQNRNDA